MRENAGNRGIMIEFADWDCRRELAGIWTECFHDPERYPRFFLNNCFSPHDCLIYRAAGRIAAAVYLLPCRILAENGTLQAHYVFAAATLPRYRSRGYMSSLLAFAAIAGAERGDRFSVVLPSGDGLYRFYEKAGYSDCFQARLFAAERGDLQSLAAPGQAGRVLPVCGRLNLLRRACLSGRTGSVLWSGRMFHFAVSMGAVYGDRLICVSRGGKDAYALCRKEDDGCCAVLELMAGEGMFPLLADEILRRMPAGSYRFRLPAGDGPFAGKGEAVRFGMAKPIGGTLPDDVRPCRPYLGLAMD